jgi:hypothetical protein
MSESPFLFLHESFAVCQSPNLIAIFSAERRGFIRQILSARLIGTTSLPIRYGAAIAQNLSNPRSSLCLLLRARDKQGDSSNQRQSPNYRREGNPFMLLSRGMNRPNIKNLFLMSIIDALIGKGQCAQDHQCNSNQGDRFHSVFSPLFDDSPSALNKPKQDDDDGRHQQDMDETT